MVYFDIVVCGNDNYSIYKIYRIVRWSKRAAEEFIQKIVVIGNGGIQVFQELSDDFMMKGKQKIVIKHNIVSIIEKRKIRERIIMDYVCLIDYRYKIVIFSNQNGLNSTQRIKSFRTKIENITNQVLLLWY